MRREDLPLCTPAQFRKFKPCPCWFETREGRARFRLVAAQRAKWNALDVLDLADASEDDQLWAVLREEFLPPMLLHEFACRCAEFGLSFLAFHDPQSIELIRVKRLWMAGEATGLDLADAAETAAMPIAREAAWEFAARSAAWNVAWDAAWYSAMTADVEPDASWFDECLNPAWQKAREHEVAMLRALIDEWGEQA